MKKANQMGKALGSVAALLSSTVLATGAIAQERATSIAPSAPAEAPITIRQIPSAVPNNLPTGGQVVSGSAAINIDGSKMRIDQSTDRLIANWQSFSIGEGYTVVFNQPNGQSVALNRVIGQDPSQILGNLIANGQVFLINPNGIVIGLNGRVETGGFVGTTLGIADADFLAGNYQFTGTGGSILNQGDIIGGVVALIAPSVVNNGTITGDTALAAGAGVTLDFDGDGLISIEVSASDLATLVENNGLIQTDGGLAILTARGASDAMRGVVNNTGVVEASSIGERDGRIYLLGDMDQGEVNAAGKLTADFVETSAARVNIDDSLSVITNGGTWLIDPNDFTIAETGGNISGTTLSNNLASGNVTITTASQGTSNGNGDIFINDTVTWSSNILTLNADRSIFINTEMFGSGTAGLALEYAQTDDGGDYFVNAPVNLASTGSFSTTRGSEDQIDYTIITELGAEDSNTGADLQGMAGNLVGNYALGANINASATSTWDGGQGFSPIALGRVSFDGLGHTITDLFISRPNEDDVGLFSGATAGTSSSNFGRNSIRNIHLENAQVTGSSRVGSIVGNAGTVSVINVSATGSVDGINNVGGLLGFLGVLGELQGSFFDGAVEAEVNVGGLVGWSRGDISQSHSSGSVSGREAIGGLAGQISGSGSPDLDQDDPRWNEIAEIFDSYSLSDVNGDTIVGGLVGDSAGSIFGSFASGLVTGREFTGGLVGINLNSLTDPGLIVSSFWDVERTGQSDACGLADAVCDATGLTSAQMRDSSIFIDAGWDFDNVWGIDPDFNDGLPYLRATQPVAVAPPPPPLPPPPPPPDTLTLGSIGNLTTDSDAFQPTINLTGSAFDDVTEIVFQFTDPNGVTGAVTWNEANNFGGGRFVVGANGDTATIAPVLVAAGDPTGVYQWTVTVNTDAQSVSRSFAVNYQAVTPPPPPPPPPPVPDPLTLTGGIADNYSTPTRPFQPPITITGTGFSTVTEIVLTYTDPANNTDRIEWSVANGELDRRFNPSNDGTSATFSPILVGSNDPVGLYRWRIEISNGGEPIVREFAVTSIYGPQQLPVTNTDPERNDGWGSISDDWALTTLLNPIVSVSRPLFLTPEERAFIDQYRENCAACATFSGGFAITDEVILHWGRNELNGTPEFSSIDELLRTAEAEGWKLTVAEEWQEVLHENTVPDVIKYISSDGHEWIFDEITGAPITADADVGTFNYGSHPILDWYTHIVRDVLPWVYFGSGPEDTTTYEQRLEAARLGEVPPERMEEFYELLRRFAG